MSNNKRMVNQLMCIITWSTYEWFSASTSIQMYLCFIHSFIYLFIHIRIDLFTWAKPQIVAVQKYWPPLLFSKHRLFDWGLFEVYSSRWVPGGGVGLCIGLLAKIGWLIFFFLLPQTNMEGVRKGRPGDCAAIPGTPSLPPGWTSLVANEITAALANCKSARNEFPSVTARRNQSGESIVKGDARQRFRRVLTSAEFAVSFLLNLNPPVKRHFGSRCKLPADEV